MTKVYPGSPPVTALREVSFAVAAGELVAIAGPSGSGKSTLLHLMGTLDRPSSGMVRVTGLDVAALSDRQLAGLRAQRIGFVFQQFFLAEHQTVAGQRGRRAAVCGRPLAERRDQAAAALERVGLGHKKRARPTQLSGGERQRVAIARALVAGQPAIVLADEPTGNLDSATGAALLALLEELNAPGRHHRGGHPRPGHRRPRCPGASRCSMARSSPTQATRALAAAPHRSPGTPGPHLEEAHDHRCCPHTSRNPATCARAAASRGYGAAGRRSGCAPVSCGPACRRSGSRSGSRRSWPCWACRPPPRPGCWPRSPGWAPTC